MHEETALPDSFTVVEHPLISAQADLDAPWSIRRRRNSASCCARSACFWDMRVTRGLKLDSVEIETPLEPMRAPVLEGKKLCIVSILRSR